MAVLILTMGRTGEGGQVLGVFADTPAGAEAAEEAATILASDLDSNLDSRDFDPTDDVLIHWEERGEWLTLERHGVVTHIPQEGGIPTIDVYGLDASPR